MGIQDQEGAVVAVVVKCPVVTKCQIQLDTGWDFVDETVNGTDDTWWMPVSDYPRLWWE